MRDNAVAMDREPHHQEPGSEGPRAPRRLVPRPEEDAAEHASRVRAAVTALERVRTQLDRTQRSLDAFVAQVTGTRANMRPAADQPVSAAAHPTGTPAGSPAAPNASARAVDSAAPAARAPDRSPTGPATHPGGAAPTSRRPGVLPPGPIADHVLPGRHPLPDPELVADAPDDEPQGPLPPRRTADDPTPRWTSRVRAIDSELPDPPGPRPPGA